MIAILTGVTQNLNVIILGLLALGWEWCLSGFCLFEAEFHIAQAGLKLTVVEDDLELLIFRPLTPY